MRYRNVWIIDENIGFIVLMDVFGQFVDNSVNCRVRIRYSENGCRDDVAIIADKYALVRSKRWRTKVFVVVNKFFDVQSTVICETEGWSGG